MIKLGVIKNSIHKIRTFSLLWKLTVCWRPCMWHSALALWMHLEKLSFTLDLLENWKRERETLKNNVETSAENF